MTSTRNRLLALASCTMLAAAACTGTASSRDRAAPAGPGGAGAAAGESLVTIPPVGPPVTSPPTPSAASPPTWPVGSPVTSAATASATGVAVALIDTDGRLGVVDPSGTVRDDWFKWDAFPSPDRSVAVLTLGPEYGDVGPERPITWVGLPGGEALNEWMMSSSLELTATSVDGAFAGLTTRAAPAPEGAIADARRTSTIEIISRERGRVFSQDLDGNFAPEAFSRRIVDGMPSQIFLLEFVPADAPTFYRVRVLSTVTGDVSLPLNLRNKTQQVDERMAGFSRSQVVADEQGLLFTLYRGTIDGTPDGEPYAFVHTLDFADGVWCLDVDPQLELNWMDGSLAVGGDRLYVASANGWMGSYSIPSISDPDLSPSMDWVVEVGPRTDASPVITADHEAAYLVDPERPGMLARVGPDGDRLAPTVMAGTAESLAWHEGALHAVGDGWATFELSDRPGWLGDIAHLVVG